jgi:hypothetical protein
MQIIEIFLPLRRGDGSEIDPKEIREIVEDLAGRFGGATAFTRAPASGLWESGSGLEKDEVIIVEVMTKSLNRDWWHSLRLRLERQFQQERIMMRATRTHPL